MGLFHALIWTVAASCGGLPTDREAKIVGRLDTFSYQTPSGESLSSTVIAVEEPLELAGLPTPATLIELRLPEYYFVRWSELAGRSGSVTCTLSVASLWGYPHASCKLLALQLDP